MSGLLYYLPGETPAIKQPRLNELGLGYALNPYGPRGCARGPDGGQGIVLAHPDHPRLGYYANEQVWRKMAGSFDNGCRPWVGYQTDARPTPADLLRPDALVGHPVNLGDGNDWTVPIARRLIPTDDNSNLLAACMLPKAIDVDDDGNWVEGDIRPRYESLWQVATSWWNKAHTVDDDEVDDDGVARLRFDLDDIYSGAVVALQANYRIGQTEVAMLGLLDEINVGQVLEALVDWPTAKAWLAELAEANSSKKNEGGRQSDGSSTEPGPSALTPTTSQPSPTSGPRA